MGRSCVTGSSGSIDKTSVTLTEKDHDGFTVTMSELTIENSGWYLCVKGDLQMPVYLTVTEKPTTTTSSTHTYESSEEMLKSHEADLKIFLIPLALLLFIVFVTLFIWFKLKNHKQSRLESSVTMKAEAEVIYCDVKHKKKNMKRKETVKMPHTESDVDVTYSSVVTRKQTVKREHNTQDQDVTYSTVTLHHQHV
ncbi:hypothetical protein Q5P01_021544 [Channa striata]|uniref:Immunoglobulin V-set domain-containing protein n=1 Tax=Channa striata TaxID=64152 RepID=A0AA88LUB7_CHASR|nr:hypothetical protein Q5P01_021544 [Channa striata]